MVALPQQRPLAPQPADRRRPLHHLSARRSSTTPGTPGTATSRGWWLRGASSRAAATTWRRSTLPAAVRDPTAHHGLQLQPAHARRPALQPAPADDRLNLRLWAGGWLGGDPLPVQRRLSLGGLDMLPGYAFRGLHLRAGRASPTRRRPRSATGRSVTQAEFRHACRSSRATPYRDQDHQELDRFIGIDEIRTWSLRRRRQGLARGDGPGGCPTTGSRRSSEWKADVGAAIDAGWRRRLPRQGGDRRRAGPVLRPAGAAVLACAGGARDPCRQAGQLRCLAADPHAPARRHGPATVAAQDVPRPRDGRGSSWPHPGGRTDRRTCNLLEDDRWLAMLRSGFPVRLHYRLEIWRSRAAGSTTWIAGWNGTWWCGTSRCSTSTPSPDWSAGTAVENRYADPGRWPQRWGCVLPDHRSRPRAATGDYYYVGDPRGHDAVRIPTSTSWSGSSGASCDVRGSAEEWEVTR